MKNFFAFLFINLIVASYAQSHNSQENYSSCKGAINLFENGKFSIKFHGNKGKSDVFSQYPALTQITSANQAWFNFIPEQPGTLSFKSNSSIPFHMILFKESKRDLCESISIGAAEIFRIQKKPTKEINLNEDITLPNSIKNFELQSGQKIAVVFIVPEKSNAELNLEWNFIPFEEEEKERIVDLRDDDFAPTFEVSVFDKTTKLPLVSSISVSGKPLNGLYQASSALFNLKRYGDLRIHCSVNGYFYVDTLVKASPSKEKRINLYLERIISGKPKQIEKIEFKPGTSVLMDASIPKLNRIKDFLALNSHLNIEIQGHVFEEGEETALGKKMSEARAKMVLKYLVENGINKKRLKAVGFGSSKPVIEEPKFSYEEQANRRVEIMITNTNMQ